MNDELKYPVILKMFFEKNKFEKHKKKCKWKKLILFS